VVRTAGHIMALVGDAPLPDRVRQRALAAFDALAIAEGRLHRRPPEQVHFHEVGGIDALIDIVGSCAALEVLGVDRVEVSPVATGRGVVRAAHGIIPNPAPATVELLRDAPVYGIDVPVELTTPTGAALAASLASAWGPMPSMTVSTVGFGAGDAELDHRPNLLQVVIGTAADARPDGQRLVQLEVNVDDATGEVLAHTVAAAIDAGAHDAWVTPILMKKGRPAHTLHALVDPSLAAQVGRVLTEGTGSFGLRAVTVERWASPRQLDQVDVDGVAIRIKVGPGRVKAEYDDAVVAARRLGRPLRSVLADAEESWRRTHPDGDGALADSTGPMGTVAPLHDHVHPHDHDHSHSHDHDHPHPHDPSDGNAG
jgi:uncharacterized protein (TIGR00299 family) protein